jgi:hypothetical protein
MSQLPTEPCIKPGHAKSSEENKAYKKAYKKAYYQRRKENG